MAQNMVLGQNLESDSFYSLQDALKAFGAVGQRSFMNAVAFGMEIIEEAGWFPNATTIHDALEQLGADYSVEQTGTNTATITCNNDHPSTFDYGIFYGIITKFRDENSSQIVVRRGINEMGTRIYHLVW